MSENPAALLSALPGVLLEPARAAELKVRGATESAVLVALYVDPRAGLHAVLTERRADLRRHAGEIAFPGGRRDPADPDLRTTALREAEEEIGLAPAQVTILGALQPTPTIATGYAIYPFVGVIEPAQAWTVSPREVEQVLELPLAAIRAGYGRRRLLRRGIPIRTDTYVVGDALIWGATARILADLFERLDSL